MNEQAPLSPGQIVWKHLVDWVSNRFGKKGVLALAIICLLLFGGGLLFILKLWSYFFPSNQPPDQIKYNDARPPFVAVLPVGDQGRGPKDPEEIDIDGQDYQRWEEAGVRQGFKPKLHHKHVDSEIEFSSRIPELAVLQYEGKEGFVNFVLNGLPENVNRTGLRIDFFQNGTRKAGFRADEQKPPYRVKIPIGLPNDWESVLQTVSVKVYPPVGDKKVLHELAQMYLCPDLSYIQAQLNSHKVKSGDRIVLKLRIKNFGGVMAQRGQIKFFFSQDHPSFDERNVIGETIDYPGLAAKETWPPIGEPPVTVKHTAPSVSVSTKYYVSLAVDAKNSTKKERDEIEPFDNELKKRGMKPDEIEKGGIKFVPHNNKAAFALTVSKN